MNGIFDYPLTVVEAPMGYGKTTAIREFFSSSETQVLWQTVYDAAPTSFWQEFCRLFKGIDGNSAQNLQELGFPHDSALLQEAVQMIADAALPDHTFWVIDDYHLLASSQIDCFVERLAMHGIPGLHIVLLTRYSGRLNIEELALKGYLHLIAKETLELTPPEITEYYKACGVNLHHDEIERLHALTEGWISALYLFMVELISHGSYTPENNIYKLIEKTVYRPLAAETKEFLLTLSLFDSFTHEQAAYMWGKDNTDELLAEVMSQNAFVNYDRRSKTYFAHNILTGFLRELLAVQEPGYRQALWRKAAAWCLNAGDDLAAMHYFYECRDFDNILLTLEKNHSASFVDGNTKLIINYLEECPEPVKAKHPFALLIYAFYLFMHNETELFGKACGEFSRVMAAPESLNHDLRKRLSGEFELLLSFTEYNDIKKMSEHQRKACELLDGPTTIYNTKKNWTFGSPSVLYMFYRESGKLEEHVSDLTESFPYYHRLAGGHGSGGEYVMEAERYFNMGEFANAEISLHKAAYKAQAYNETSILLCVRFLQNRLAFMNGDFALMLELLHTMRDELTGTKKYFYLHTVELCEGGLYSYLGQKNKIPEWVASGDLNNTQLMFPAFAMVNIVYGRVLLIQGDYLKLIGGEEHFFGVAAVFSNLLGQIYTHIYLAAAHHRLFREAEALDHLRRALDIALPDKLYMPFAENSDFIKPLLEKFYNQDYCRKDLARVLELCAVYETAADQIVREHFSGEKPKLTERELEIAQLAAARISNREIGARLYISENTVKMALKKIFEKLGINSRALLKKSLMDLDSQKSV